MLYLMVVRVFGATAKKWHYFLPLGWGLPVPVVTTSAGILEGLYKSYTHPDHCWLNGGPGSAAILIFIIPILIIIIINSVLLVISLASIIKSKKQGRNNAEMTNKALIWTAVKSLLILLPLMGVTWVIGLFSVEENTTVFAWLFTIFNSLQGVCIFMLHVWRNPVIRDKIKKIFKCHTRKDTTSVYTITNFRIVNGDHEKVNSLKQKKDTDFQESTAM